MSYRSMFWGIVAGALLAGTLPAVASESMLVIAHRGASGYLPEHTLPAKAMAYGMGADFLEQDVILTKDDQPIICHDRAIDTVTDVAERFPDRARPDGRYYAIDFTLEEIKQLRVSERLDPKTKQPAFPNRFPRGKSEFRLATLQEEIELVQGLNRSTGRNVGIYPELKSAEWHQENGKDLTRIVLDLLAKNGYNDKESNCYLQCFDAPVLKRARFELGSKLKMIQLINTRTKDLATPEGLDDVKTYADGVGPDLKFIVQGRDAQGTLQLTSLVANAHARGLKVHVYTLRADELPPYATDYTALAQIFCKEAQVDGAFTDFPDRLVNFLKQ